MFYRVVMQGRTLGGANVEEVKRDFVRVTGLPPPIAEKLFGGMPQVVQRQLPQEDAERIAATLRAIGVAATVERELQDTEEETPEGIQVHARPLNDGPHTVTVDAAAVPDSTPAPSRHARLLRTVRARWPLVVGGTVLVAGVILLAPVADDLITELRGAQERVRAAPKRTPAPEIPQSVPAMNATLMHGPWRCTDQGTGVSTYWSYGANGALIFYGDALSDGPAPPGAATSGPTGWKLDGERLFHTFAKRPPETYTVADLTLARLRYGDERGFAMECRRP